MIDLILKEFKCAGYEKLSISDNNLLVLKHKSKSDFWIIVNDFDLENQSDFYVKNQILFHTYKEAEKNTSLLILKVSEQINDSEKEWRIEVENNQFYFKKYVLYYSEEDKNSLLTILENNEVKQISSFLMIKNNFDELKKEKDEKGPYTLLYSIAHKLPFIMMKITKVDYKMEDPIASLSEKETHTMNMVESILANGSLQEQEQEIDKILEEQEDA